ncbi:MAG: hypothetical protein SVM80_09995 [Halobacteriota archaeon]|nr:hypothetical protein [Halobacteriota archaeon]
MAEERVCPLQYDTKMFKRPPCGAKIVRREPVLSPEKIVGHITGPTKIEEARALDDMVLYYVYQCEVGHTFTRPDGWADVPTVEPGSITCVGFSGTEAIANTPPSWYHDLSDEEKEKIWKG